MTGFPRSLGFLRGLSFFRCLAVLTLATIDFKAG